MENTKPKYTEHMKIAKAEYYIINKDAIISKSTIWKNNNREASRQHARDLYNRRKNDPEYMLYRATINKRALLKKKMVEVQDLGPVRDLDLTVHDDGVTYWNGN